MSFLSSLIASRVTGQYDFAVVPLLLPTELVAALVASSSSLLSLRTPKDLTASGFQIPPAGDGMSWVVVEAGQQIKTGMSLPGGRSDFMEAKLEIPFLRHSVSSNTALVTLKHTLLFSTTMMALSSRTLTGLRSQKVNIETGESGEYEVDGWIRISDDDAAAGGDDTSWSFELVRQVVEGWWVGERSGVTATKFRMTPLVPPYSKRVFIQLHLPSFAQLSVPETCALISSSELTMSDDGWVSFHGQAWMLSAVTAMDVASVDSI